MTVHKRTNSMRSDPAAEAPSWDDLRLLQAVGRAGSLRKAAARLGLGHATLSRRLARLEVQLGVRLFDRPSAGAVVLTPAGDELAASAAQMDDTAAAAHCQSGVGYTAVFLWCGDGCGRPWFYWLPQ